jgi:two-component system cell cycle sensor histidine kinase PleC
MPIPGEQPDLAALPPDTSPVKRRLAAQYVREARDRLTSSSGTRPKFDHELVGQYAQNRISASLIILLLFATVGFMSSLWTGVFAAGTWTAAVLVIHAIMITKCRRFLERPMQEVSLSAWRVRFLLLKEEIPIVLTSFGQGSNSTNRQNKELAWDGRSPRAWLIFMAERSL